MLFKPAPSVLLMNRLTCPDSSFWTIPIIIPIDRRRLPPSLPLKDSLFVSAWVIGSWSMAENKPCPN